MIIILLPSSIISLLHDNPENLLLKSKICFGNIKRGKLTNLPWVNRFLFLLLIIVQLAQEMYLAGNWARITWSNNLLTSNKNVSKNHVRFQSNAELTKAINCGALWGVPYLVLYHIVNSACYLNVGQNDPCWIRKRSVCFWKIIF